MGKDLAGLVREIDKVAANSKGSIAYLVSLDDDKAGARKKLTAFAAANKLKAVDMTINRGGAKAPRGWKINDKAKHTVVIYKNKKVVKTFGLNKIDKKSVAEITAAPPRSSTADTFRLFHGRPSPSLETASRVFEFSSIESFLVPGLQ